MEFSNQIKSKDTFFHFHFIFLSTRNYDGMLRTKTATRGWDNIIPKIQLKIKNLTFFVTFISSYS